MSAEPDEHARQWLDVADEVLSATCVGWRERRRCVDAAGLRLPDPHPACLHAQLVHDRTLIEHGLLAREGNRPPTDDAGSARRGSCELGRDEVGSAGGERGALGA